MQSPLVQSPASMRLLQRMTNKTLLLGRMLWRQRPSCSVVALPTPLFHNFALFAFGQSIPEKTVLLIVGSTLGLIPEVREDKHEEQTAHHDDKAKVTYTALVDPSGSV